MRFDKIIPGRRLKPYIRHFVISENTHEQIYKIFPSAGLVMGFQYKGKLSLIKESRETCLAPSGITGLQDRFKLFKNSANTGTVLVFFKETGIPFFSDCPAHELFNQSVSLDNFFDRSLVSQAEEKLSSACTDTHRVKIVEHFLLSQLKKKEEDKLIAEAVKLIYESGGKVRIRELNKKLHISQSPFEKRFRKLVGSSPKKFASIVRFNCALKNLSSSKSLTGLGYENDFFDQAHFIKDFRKYTGDTPESFKSNL